MFCNFDKCRFYRFVFKELLIIYTTKVDKKYNTEFKTKKFKSLKYLQELSNLFSLSIVIEIVEIYSERNYAEYFIVISINVWKWKSVIN